MQLTVIVEEPPEPSVKAKTKTKDVTKIVKARTETPEKQETDENEVQGNIHLLHLITK